MAKWKPRKAPASPTQMAVNVSASDSRALRRRASNPQATPIRTTTRMLYNGWRSQTIGAPGFCDCRESVAPAAAKARVTIGLALTHDERLVIAAAGDASQT